MNFCMISETQQVTAFQVVLKMNLAGAIVYLSLLNLFILSRTLGLDFVLRPPKIPFIIYRKL